jgi:hypothetical protein
MNLLIYQEIGVPKLGFRNEKYECGEMVGKNDNKLKI